MAGISGIPDKLLFLFPLLEGGQGQFFEEHTFLIIFKAVQSLIKWWTSGSGRNLQNFGIGQAGIPSQA